MIEAPGRGLQHLSSEKAWDRELWLANCIDAVSVERRTVRNARRRMERSRRSVYAQTVKRFMKLKRTTGAGSNRPVRNDIQVRRPIRNGDMLQEPNSEREGSLLGDWRVQTSPGASSPT